MTLQPLVDCETSSSWIHTGYVLCVVNVFKGELVTIIPMIIVEMLTDQCVRLNCTVIIFLKYEIKENLLVYLDVVSRKSLKIYVNVVRK